MTVEMDYSDIKINLEEVLENITYDFQYVNYGYKDYVKDIISKNDIEFFKYLCERTLKILEDDEYKIQKKTLITNIITDCLVEKINMDMLKYILDNSDLKRSVDIEKLFMSAIYHNNFEVIEYLISIDPTKCYRNIDKYWVFDTIVDRGLLDMMKYFFRERPDIYDLSLLDYESFFYGSIYRGNISLLRYIKEIKPEINIINTTSENTSINHKYLHGAVYYGFYEIVIQLLEWYPKDIDCKEYIDNELMNCACSGKNINIVKLLYSLNPDKNIIDIDCFKTLFRNGSLDILKYLLELNPEIDISDKYIIKSVFLDGHYGIIEFIYETRKNLIYNLNKKDFEEIFLYSCINNYIDIVKFVYEKVEDFDISFEEEISFIEACKYGNIEIVELLYEWKPTINMDVNNGILLKTICSHGHLKILNKIFEFRPEKKVITEEIFLSGIKSRNIEMVRQLYEWNPKINLSYCDNIFFKQCFEYIHTRYYFEILKQLCEWSPEFRLSTISSEKIINYFKGDVKKNVYEDFYRIDKDIYNEELFTHAAYIGNNKLLKYIKEIKPDIDISYDNEKALSNACNHGNLTTVKLLFNWKNSINYRINDNSIIKKVCKNGYVHILKEFLKRTKDIEENLIRECIKLSVENHRSEILEYLHKEYKELVEKDIKYHFEYSIKREYIYIVKLIYNWNREIVDEYFKLNAKLLSKNMREYFKKLGYVLPVCWKEEKINSDEDVTCLICTENIKEYLKTPCGHVYCERCIMEWIKINEICPYCRSAI